MKVKLKLKGTISFPLLWGGTISMIIQPGRFPLWFGMKNQKMISFFFYRIV